VNELNAHGTERVVWFPVLVWDVGGMFAINGAGIEPVFGLLPRNRIKIFFVGVS